MRRRFFLKTIFASFLSIFINPFNFAKKALGGYYPFTYDEAPGLGVYYLKKEFEEIEEIIDFIVNKFINEIGVKGYDYRRTGSHLDFKEFSSGISLRIEEGFLDKYSVVCEKVSVKPIGTDNCSCISISTFRFNVDSKSYKIFPANQAKEGTNNF